MRVKGILVKLVGFVLVDLAHLSSTIYCKQLDLFKQEKEERRMGLPLNLYYCSYYYILWMNISATATVYVEKAIWNCKTPGD